MSHFRQYVALSRTCLPASPPFPPTARSSQDAPTSLRATAPAAVYLRQHGLVNKEKDGGPDPFLTHGARRGRVFEFLFFGGTLFR